MTSTGATAKMVRKIVWRGGWAIVVATAVACLYCAVVSAETALFGLLVGPFVAPSVVLFLILERTSPTRLPKYLGFFLPMLLILGGCFYRVWSLRSQAVPEGISEGADEIFLYFARCYFVALCFAFAFLQARQKGAG